MVVGLRIFGRGHRILGANAKSQKFWLKFLVKTRLQYESLEQACTTQKARRAKLST